MWFATLFATKHDARMEPGNSIRRATVEDAEAIAQLSTSLGYGSDVSVMAQRLSVISASDADLIIVATDAVGAVVGWLQAHAATIIESGFRVEITGLIIAPEERRRGMGRALVAEAEQWARSIGAEAVVVRSNVQRAESHIFYPALGFSATKTQKVYRKAIHAAVQ
jgi:predicted N-acetyltransferase YhbS